MNTTNNVIKLASLRHRMTLETPQRTDDGGGGAVVTWQPVAVVWAGLMALRGNEALRYDRLTGTVTHRIIIRYRSDVTPEMRFTRAGRAFDIRAVLDMEGRRRWLHCLCEEQDL